MAKCDQARKWKRRYKDAVSARRIDQAKAFEERSNLQGQLRAVDHLIARAQFGEVSYDPTIDSSKKWMDDAIAFLRELQDIRKNQRTEGYTTDDIQKMRMTFELGKPAYVEHFGPGPGVPPYIEQEGRSYSTGS